MSASTSRPLTAGSPKVPDVSTLPCPAVSGRANHEMVNTPAGHTSCMFCRVSWADLDQRVRTEATP